MKVALRIDVTTCRGAAEGVPRLLEMLTQHEAQATFLFSLGPDRGGDATSRPSMLHRLEATLSGMRRAPEIGAECAARLKEVTARGFEVGIQAWDHVQWRANVAHAAESWIEGEMRRAIDRFRALFDDTPLVLGVPGWQTSRAALRLTQRLGFAYASDTRGTHPFLPVCDAETVRCPQIPTTLPTLVESMLGDGLDANGSVGAILSRAEAGRAFEVFSLQAELEGMKLAPVFDALLHGWRRQGHAIVALRDVLAGIDVRALPFHIVHTGSVPGRGGTLAVQGGPFLEAMTDTRSHAPLAPSASGERNASPPIDTSFPA